MIGERDGFIRYLYLSKDLEKRRNSSAAISSSSTKKQQQLIECHDALRKPIVVQTELNHLQMASGKLPLPTKKSGRSDLETKYDNGPLSLPQAQLARTVVDFMYIHSKQHLQKQQNHQGMTITKRYAAEERLLEECQTSAKILEPFVQLSNQAEKTLYVEKQVRTMLLEESEQLRSKVSSPRNTARLQDLNIVSEWRIITKDFLYSKPRLSSCGKSGKIGNHHTFLHLQLLEQDPIDIGRFVPKKKGAPPLFISQISKTLAVKCKSFDAICEFLGMEQQKKSADDEPQRIVQTMNQKTFYHVLLNVVTPEQRKRYLEDETTNKLMFGSDYCMDAAPKWVEQGLVIEKNIDGDFVLRSPTVVSPMSSPQFPGMYYFKPLTPCQAYEWIVFDSFKKIP